VIKLADWGTIVGEAIKLEKEKKRKKKRGKLNEY